jgi:hypothetical protein
MSAKRELVVGRNTCCTRTMVELIVIEYVPAFTPPIVITGADAAPV